MEAIAKTRNLKGSPRKARLVIDLIRGRNVSQALAILKFTDKRAAEPITKTLQSAIANATYQAEQQNIAIDPDDLFVKSCFVDMGPHKNRRRMRPAPQGRAYRETRHYCHITILVSSDKPEVEEKPRVEKKVKAKAEPAKETKKAKAKVEEVETPATETPVETSEQTSPKKADKKAAEQEAENKADAADAKNAETQTVAEIDATKPADEAQIDKNEELEKQ
jgi:large subunit ribosomal protein L22